MRKNLLILITITINNFNNMFKGYKCNYQLFINKNKS